MQYKTLRPGLLVSVKSSVEGNVSWSKQMLESDRETTDGALVARWETERKIADPAEHEAASKIRSKARSLLAGVCSRTAFGYLCPEDKASDLDEAIAEARRITDDFNGKATLTHVRFYVMCGRIAPDDVEAVRAISSEVRDLMRDMEDGLKSLDVTAVRNAANRARSVGQMLSPQMQERVKAAVDAARSAAKQIVKAGENAAIEIDTQAIASIARQRTAFLDFDDVREVSAPVADGRAVDFAPEDMPAIVVPKHAAGPQLEME